MLNKLCLSSRPAVRIGNQKSVGLGIYPIYTGYILPLNRDKPHWVIPRISIHATDTYRDIPSTNNPVWVIPCLSQVHSDGPKDIPGITFWCDYTLYIPGINPDKPSYPTGIRFQMICLLLRNVTSLGSNLASVTDLKRIQFPHSLCCDFGGYKTFVQVWVQVWAPASHLAIFPQEVPEGNWRFRVQNQLPSSWGLSPALLAQVGWMSTNTGRFRVCSSRFGPQPARLRKICYYSCYTDSVQESKMF